MRTFVKLAMSGSRGWWQAWSECDDLGLRRTRTAKASAELEQRPLHNDVEQQAERDDDTAYDDHQQEGRNGWNQVCDRCACQRHRVHLREIDRIGLGRIPQPRQRKFRP